MFTRGQAANIGFTRFDRPFGFWEANAAFWVTYVFERSSFYILGPTRDFTAAVGKCCILPH